ncbi:MAG: substrate-binding domain-containing protein [Oscillospiraceae bacterium]|nr:substrate-binding domain-containing protein [Oscillospiraceae bacterium]
MLQRVSGISEAQAYERANFSKTTEAYTRLANPSEAVDLILVYEGAPNDQWLGNPLELEKHAVGRDALVFLTSKSNPVDGITSAQARDIYAGKITNWKQLGGKDEAIVAYQRPGDSGSQILMQKLVMGDTAMTDAPTELRIAEMGGLMDAIASYQSGGSALGYSVYYYAQNMYQNPDLKLLKIDGVAPSNQTISAGDYPFLNPFYAVVRANAAKDSPARQLLNWILSDAGARCVEDAGYVAAK